MNQHTTNQQAMASLVHNFSGSCHCGAIGFTFHTALPVPQWSIRACQCRFCRAHAALSTSDPAGRLEFHVNDAGSLQCYRFGLKTADFLVCGRCGVYVGAQIESARGAFGIINVLALTPAVPGDLPAAAPMDYSGESSGGERVRRREDKWTPLAAIVRRSAGAKRARPRAARRPKSRRRSRR